MIRFRLCTLFLCLISQCHKTDPVAPSPHRGQRLEESLEYQQFVANVEEEEAWINEKMTLVASEDYGDTLAAIQVWRKLSALYCCIPAG